MPASISAHPIDLEKRALAAYRRRNATWPELFADCQSIRGRLYVVVRELGVAVAVYMLRDDGKLRGLHGWPNCIW